MRTMVFGLVTLISTALLSAQVKAPGGESTASPTKASSLLVKARAGHTTVLKEEVSDKSAWPKPPDARFTIETFPGPLGAMKGLLARPDRPKKQNPAILWVTGGFPSGGIGDSAWFRQDPDNDQSAQAFRRAGMMVFYPGLRGTFGNPGHQESFYGEVDDVIAAGAWLAKRPDVDPERIYLGGHSTGGTLALLVASATDLFRGVLCFGAVEDPANYGAESLTYDPRNEKERDLRRPLKYLMSIRRPTLIIEGEDGNASSHLELLKASIFVDAIDGHLIARADHFDVLAPTCEFIAKRMVRMPAKKAMAFTEKELQRAFDEAKRKRREVWDIEHVAAMRKRGQDISRPCRVDFHYWAEAPEELGRLAKAAKALGFRPGEPTKQGGDDEEVYFTLAISRTLTLQKLDTVFAASAQATTLGKEHEGYYRGWDVVVK